MTEIKSFELSFIIICFVLWILIYCPIIIYHLIQYQSNATNIVYLYRYSNITLIQNILLICKLGVGVFSTISAIWFFGHYSVQHNIIRAANAYLAALFLYCFVWKFWLLRYNIMLNNIVINSEWKSILNHKKYEATNTFYAKYKRTWGNVMCTMYIWLIIAIILTTMFVLTHIVYPEFYGHSQDTNPYLKELYAGWDYIVPFLLLIVIYIKTPQFEDNFYITAEMKRIFICLCIMYIVYYGYLAILWLIYPMITDLSEHTADLIEDIAFLIEYQVVIGMQFAAMMFSTYWVNKRCDSIVKEHRYQIHKVSSKLSINLQQKHCIEIQPKYRQNQKDTLDSTTKNSSNTGLFVIHGSLKAECSDSPSSSTFRDGLYDILSTKSTYIEFIKHLSKEFSIECLLSLTEMIQYREYMISQLDTHCDTQYGDELMDVDDGLEIDEEVVSEKHRNSSFVDELVIKLPSDIPQSYIVENQEWDNKEKAYMLYTKYIKNGSELEINISCEQRTYYDGLMADYATFISNHRINTRELISLFVPCCTQMIYLMIDSRKRFEETAIFQKLQRNNNY